MCDINCRGEHVIGGTTPASLLDQDRFSSLEFQESIGVMDGHPKFLEECRIEAEEINAQCWLKVKEPLFYDYRCMSWRAIDNFRHNKVINSRFNFSTNSQVQVNVT